MECSGSQCLEASEESGPLKIDTRFGEVEYEPEHLLCFPEGLIGFEGLRDFIVMPNAKEGPLFWIQSVDEPAIAFVLTDPTSFFPEYRVLADKNERQRLNMAEQDDCYVLSVVTVSPQQQITLNLAAPLLFAPASNRALQVLLESPQYQSRTPLPVVD